MKKILKYLEGEKKRILEQYDNSLIVETSRFKKLLKSSLGNVKPLLEEGGPESLPPDVKKNLWTQISQKPEIKKHLEILPHHNEHNFLQDLGHKFHMHIDPKTKHLGVEIPGLGKQHNFTLSLGSTFDTSHGTHDEHNKNYAPTPHSLVDAGVKINLGGDNHKQKFVPKF